jgi:predicted nucleic acid-binding protein
MRTAVDTSVFSALWSGEPSASAMSLLLGGCRNAGGLVICGAVYAELLAHPKSSHTFVDRFLADTDVQIDFDLGEIIWRDIARSFAKYAQRRRDSNGTAIKRLLADFIVAGHASGRADRLITLDPSRYQLDYPSLTLLP